MSKDESTRATLPLYELLGVSADQAGILDPRGLLELLLKDDGKAQFLQTLSKATGRAWNDEAILTLLSGKATSTILEKTDVTQNRELSHPKELITSAISRAKLVWLRAHQTIDILANDRGNGLSCIGISTQELVPGFSYAGERNISSYGAGMLGSGKDNFTIFCLDPTNYGQHKTSFENIWEEIKQNGLAARVSDTEYFLMGRFSSEKRFVQSDRKSGRNRPDNYMRIKFGSPDELHAFLGTLHTSNPNASELLCSLVEASITDVNSLPTRNKPVDAEKLLESVKSVGLDVNIPSPIPFTEKQLKDIESLRLDRPEDVR